VQTCSVDELVSSTLEVDVTVVEEVVVELLPHG
jgi:hypothetical protein